MNEFINKKVKFLDLGSKDYKETWDFQEEIFAKTVSLKIANRNAAPEAQQITDNYLIFVEHPHVYTLGKSGEESHLLLDENGLIEKQATFYKINRGGDITYHGPGQLVGYPILDLDNFFTDIHKYLRLLEEAIILTLADYGIEAGRIDGLTGVWIDHIEQKNPRKICAMGVKSSRWVTMHGFAFNVNADIDYFNNIIPCGIPDKAVTSMHLELGRPLDLDEVKEKVKRHIIHLFEMEE
ncbi:Octanoate-[acyl-carrier-protein]-protein-N-octan oyltransferase [Indibacter alkaliphilus LW1]|uniref:Octanoyltransferase n=1 Tax=Indibacter alkaliphilus (strain CCUG 57479 / KCTC 22604 / LW1) TaxID=1189612 RepID=S2E3L8_INDAL|nr:lipoyl(octanoyl) transferase LipB [Indibacter alkaliphilus]EOZ96793.1 Octanoate-[acyl-carrier-protein]-protein-N-octan oyltransferase [Indibacter alkaliphilus LW1]